MRSAPRRWAVLFVVAGLMLGTAACTGDESPSGEGDGPGTPGEVAAAVTGDSELIPRLTVSFAPVDGAEGYLVALGEDQPPIRVAADECADDGCSITLSPTAVAGARSATVTAVTSGGSSSPSEAVELPEWPAPPTSTASPEDATELVVVRLGEDGTPTVETEPVPPGTDVDALIDQLEAADDVLGVAPNGGAAPLLASEGEADDDSPEGSPTWQTEALEFDQLPPEPRGAGVTIALLDDGVDPGHPSLRDADVTPHDASGSNPGWHDTAISSLLVGQPGEGVPGIATGAKILDYDIADEESYYTEGPFTADDVTAAMIRAIGDGADIINVSYDLGGPGYLEALQPVAQYAEEQGVLIVAAAGNDGESSEACGNPGGEANQDNLPAMLPTVVAVGGTTRDGEVWRCSPDKDYIDVLAPAENLRMADADGGYFVASGTSAAAPLVAGFVATILAEKPELTPAQIRDLLSRCLADNLRLIPSLCLREAGIAGPDGPVVDPSTGDEVMPFATQVSFPPGHPVYEAAAKVRDTDHLQFGRWNSTPLGDEPFTMQVSGTLVVHDDGSVDGRATLAPLAGDTMVEEGADIDRIGHLVECPVGDVVLGRRSPYLLFDWSIALDVTGQLDDDAGSDSRALELTLDPRGVSGMNVVADTFSSRCPPAIEASYLVPGKPGPGDYTWGEVSGWPGANIAAIEPVYDEFSSGGPYTFAGFYSADATPDNVLGSGEEVDSVGYQLNVGSADPTTF